MSVVGNDVQSEGKKGVFFYISKKKKKRKRSLETMIQAKMLIS
jgi:hypothetical protein